MIYQLMDFGAGMMSDIDLTADEYRAIKKARDGVILISEIEDKFDLLVENFASLELSLLEFALRSSLFQDSDYADMMHTRQLFNRQLVNFLSATYLYTEQVKGDAAKGFSRKLLNHFREQLEEQRSAHLSFRFIEALRHHAQHRSLPVVGVSVTHHAEGDLPSRRSRTSAEALIDIKDLFEDKRFDRSILAELSQRGDHKDDFDVMPFVREYVQSAAIVHGWVRRETQDDFNLWKRGLHGAIDRITAISQPDAIVAMVCRSNAETDDDQEKPIFITPKLYERIDTLRRKNTALEHLAARYVASIKSS